MRVRPPPRRIALPPLRLPEPAPGGATICLLTHDMDTRGFAAALDALVAGTRSVQDVTTETGAGIDLLPALVERLTSDLPIDALERLEALVKAILGAACSRGATGAEARAIAEFQQRVGFLLKYKSYAVKCANPLG